MSSSTSVPKLLLLAVCVLVASVLVLSSLGGQDDSQDATFNPEHGDNSELSTSTPTTGGGPYISENPLPHSPRYPNRLKSDFLDYDVPALSGFVPQDLGGAGISQTLEVEGQYKGSFSVLNYSDSDDYSHHFALQEHESLISESTDYVTIGFEQIDGQVMETAWFVDFPFEQFTFSGGSDGFRYVRRYFVDDYVVVAEVNISEDLSRQYRADLIFEDIRFLQPEHR